MRYTCVVQTLSSSRYSAADHTRRNRGRGWSGGLGAPTSASKFWVLSVWFVPFIRYNTSPYHNHDTSQVLAHIIIPPSPCTYVIVKVEYLLPYTLSYVEIKHKRCGSYGTFSALYYTFCIFDRYILCVVWFMWLHSLKLNTVCKYADTGG